MFSFFNPRNHPYGQADFTTSEISLRSLSALLLGVCGSLLHLYSPCLTAVVYFTCEKCGLSSLGPAIRNKLLQRFEESTWELQAFLGQKLKNWYV